MRKTKYNFLTGQIKMIDEQRKIGDKLNAGDVKNGFAIKTLARAHKDFSGTDFLKEPLGFKYQKSRIKKWR